MLLNCGVGEDSWESLGLQGDPTSPSLKEISAEYSLPGLMLKRNSNTLATRCKELTHWKRPWCCERLKVGREWDERGWDGWMASLTWWTWIWASSRSLWWTAKPGVLQSMELQRVRHNWATELNWTEPSRSDSLEIPRLLSDPRAGKPDIVLRTFSNSGRTCLVLPVSLFSSLWVTHPTGMGFSLIVIVPLLPFCCSYFFVFGCELSFIGGFQHPSVDG